MSLSALFTQPLGLYCDICIFNRYKYYKALTPVDSSLCQNGISTLPRKMHDCAKSGCVAARNSFMAKRLYEALQKAGIDTTTCP